MRIFNLFGLGKEEYCYSAEFCTGFPVLKRMQDDEIIFTLIIGTEKVSLYCSQHKFLFQAYE